MQVVLCFVCYFVQETRRDVANVCLDPCTKGAHLKPTHRHRRPSIQTTPDGKITFVTQAQQFVGASVSGAFTPFATTDDTASITSSVSSLQSQLDG